MIAGTQTFIDTGPAVPEKSSRTGAGDQISSRQPRANIAGINPFQTSPCSDGRGRSGRGGGGGGSGSSGSGSRHKGNC